MINKLVASSLVATTVLGLAAPQILAQDTSNIQKSPPQTIEELEALPLTKILRLFSENSDNSFDDVDQDMREELCATTIPDMRQQIEDNRSLMIEAMEDSIEHMQETGFSHGSVTVENMELAIEELRDADPTRNIVIAYMITQDLLECHSLTQTQTLEEQNPLLAYVTKQGLER